VREAALEDFGREIGSALSAERAISHDPGVRHGHDRGGNVLTATFALHGVVANAGLG
jgi:hypothetical protein